MREAEELENAFTELDRRVDASDIDVAKREFVFFRALEYGNRPLRLHKVMASDPEFYHHLLCLVFRSKGRSPKAGMRMQSTKTLQRTSESLRANSENGDVKASTGGGRMATFGRTSAFERRRRRP
jgi:hypothetical protein